MSKDRNSTKLMWLSLATSFLGLFSSLIALVPSTILKAIIETDFKKIFNQQINILFTVAIFSFLISLLLLYFAREARSTIEKSSFSMTVASISGVIVSLIIIFNLYIDTPSCNGITCANKDPVYAGCHKQSTTVESTDLIDLRFSTKCQSAWMRADVKPRSIIYLENKNGQRFGTYYVPDKENMITGKYFSNMAPVEKGVALRACVESLQKSVVCTNFFSDW